MTEPISLSEMREMRVLRDLKSVADTAPARHAASVIDSAPKRAEGQFRCLLSSWLLDATEAVGRETALRILREKLNAEGAR